MSDESKILSRPDLHVLICGKVKPVAYGKIVESDAALRARVAELEAEVNDSYAKSQEDLLAARQSIQTSDELADSLRRERDEALETIAVRDSFIANMTHAGNLEREMLTSELAAAIEAGKADKALIDWQQNTAAEMGYKSVQLEPDGSVNWWVDPDNAVDELGFFAPTMREAFAAMRAAQAEDKA